MSQHSKPTPKGHPFIMRYFAVRKSLGFQGRSPWLEFSAQSLSRPSHERHAFIIYFPKWVQGPVGSRRQSVHDQTVSLQGFPPTPFPDSLQVVTIDPEKIVVLDDNSASQFYGCCCQPPPSALYSCTRLWYSVPRASASVSSAEKRDRCPSSTSR